MTDRAGRRPAAVRGGVCWAAGVLVLLVVSPLVAGSRLPDRLATHWDTGSGKPDGSMPLWAASLFPAVIWTVAATMLGLAWWRARATSRGAAPGWIGATLGFGGVALLGGQLSVVRANLDHADWREADSVAGPVVVTLLVAAAVAGAALMAGRRSSRVAALTADPRAEADPATTANPEEGAREAGLRDGRSLRVEPR
ncbi:DUF1648 domain-containing protein [Streptomyces sp. NPDC050674]|uniref:DUF1648 domain-containing protein n=1 Tax=Streptomyces sp. NPDC050674 TaxID=3157216 RepID=UPI0034167599